MGAALVCNDPQWSGSSWPPPGQCTFLTPSPAPPHRPPSSLSPCRQPPLPLSCPYISCLSPPCLLPSLSLTSSPQLQGGTLLTCLQSRPSQLSRRSRSPRSRPPQPSPTAPSVRAGGAGRGRFGQVGTVTCPCPLQGGSSRAGGAVRGCLLAWPLAGVAKACSNLQPRVPWAWAAP